MTEEVKFSKVDPNRGVESGSLEKLGQFYKVKAHLQKNRNLYLMFGIGVLVGGATVYLVVSRSSQTVSTIQGVSYKSPVTNNVIQQVLPRAGHAGKVLIDKESGEVFMSMRKLADSLGVSPQAVRRYLSGDLSALGGRQFTLLLDGAPDIVAAHSVYV